MHDTIVVEVSQKVLDLANWGYFIILVLAIVHIFCTKVFEHMAHIDLDLYNFDSCTVQEPVQSSSSWIDRFLVRHESGARFVDRHRGAFDILGEGEYVFAIWGFILIVWMGMIEGSSRMLYYFDHCNPAEPMFVFAIMVVSASKPVKRFASDIMTMIASWLPVHKNIGLLFILLTVGPILGSFITEAASMTITALLLGGYYFQSLVGPGRDKHTLRYRILATLFVNVSIGGVLTHYAAPPVLMVARAWGWDTPFMFANFGVYAIVAVIVNALLVLALHYRQILSLPEPKPINGDTAPIPKRVTIFHLAIMVGIVYFSHYPKMFMTILLIYIAAAIAYPKYQYEKLFFRESVKVGLFLWGLVIIGGKQSWWLQPILTSIDDTSLYFATTGLTAFLDNAMITYLGTQVSDLTDSAKYFLVAGAVTGGGLSMIANAPNPAGISILKEYFGDATIGAVGLFLYALVPTSVAAIAFLVLPRIF